MCQSRPCEHPCMRTYQCLYLRVSVHLCLGRRRMEHRGQFLFHELSSQLSIPTGENQPERGCQGLWESRGVGASRSEGGVPAGLARSSCRPPRWSCSREQQAAHLVQEPQRGRRWGGGRSPQASHKSQLWSQGAGGGQGPGGSCCGTHAGPGREARVRCGCKSSPKCFQAEANQAAVTAHTRPSPTGPWGAHSCLRKHIHTHRYESTPAQGLLTELCSQGTTPGYLRHRCTLSFLRPCMPVLPPTHGNSAVPVFIHTHGHGDGLRHSTWAYTHTELSMQSTRQTVQHSEQPQLWAKHPQEERNRRGRYARRVPASGFSPQPPRLGSPELGPHPIQQSFKSQSLLCPELTLLALSLPRCWSQTHFIHQHF